MGSHTTSIDLEYRPASYFWAAERGITLLSDIKGAERRKLYARALEAGQGDEVPDPLIRASLTDQDRACLGSIHPAFMGGEYLPDRSNQEVEIARITIASTTQDVTCVYARQVGNRIHYRVVDEYEGMTLDEPVTRTSTQPLKLKELVAFLLKLQQERHQLLEFQRLGAGAGNGFVQGHALVFVHHTVMDPVAHLAGIHAGHILCGGSDGDACNLHFLV